VNKILAVGVILSLLVIPATASAQLELTLRQVQGVGDSVSPYLESLVTVRGTVHCPAGIYNAGSFYIYDKTAGLLIYDAGNTFQLGDSVWVTGTVIEYNGETEISGPDAVGLIAVDRSLDTLVTTVDTAKMEFYEGYLARIEGTIITAPTGGYNPSFDIADATDTMTVFVDGTTGIDVSGIDVGENWTVIGMLSDYQGNHEIKPRYQTDLIADPNISGVCPDPYYADSGTQIAVGAKVTAQAGVASVTLYYRQVGGGGFSTTAMSPMGGDYYEGSFTPGASVDYEFYVEAFDNNTVRNTYPGGADVGLYIEIPEYATSISTIQIASQDTLTQMNGEIVCVHGVVTAGSGTYNPFYYMIQDPAGGAWSGIKVYDPRQLVVVAEGDEVNITGEVGEYFDESEINIGVCESSIEIVSSGNPLPNPLVVTVGQVDTLEALECVLIAIEGAVVDTSGFGNEIRLIDTPDTCVMGDDGTWYPSYVPSNGDIIDVYGCVQYSFGSFKIEPRFPSDVVFPATGAGQVDGIAARKFALEQNAPNPFNPATVIKFNVPKSGHAALRVFNLSGQVVKTLVDREMEQGSYSVTWSGLDDHGNEVASGVYFYQLEAAGKRATKKMVMLK
jgi:hypothetical protein